MEFKVDSLLNSKANLLLPRSILAMTGHGGAVQNEATKTHRLRQGNTFAQTRQAIMDTKGRAETSLRNVPALKRQEA